jgi:hypothetical protein
MSFVGHDSILELKAECEDLDCPENEVFAEGFEGLVDFIVFSGDRFHCSKNCKTTEFFNLVVANYKNINYAFEVQCVTDCFSVLSTILADFKYDQNLYKTTADIILLILEAVENRLHLEAVSIYEYFHNFLRHLPAKETPNGVVAIEFDELST